MDDDSLILALPDFVAFVRRDGSIVRHLGGRDVRRLSEHGDLAGKKLAELWPEHVSELLQRMIQRCLANRSGVDATFSVDGTSYETRVTAHGKARALCVIRPAIAAPQSDERESTTSAGRPGLERRAFFASLKDAIADASLRERPLAVCMVFLDGLTDIGRVIDFSIADRIGRTLIERLTRDDSPTSQPTIRRHVGQMSENVLTVVFQNYSGREQLRDAAHNLCEALREPIVVGDARFSLTPCAGIALLGQDAQEPRALLEHARAAMMEARRASGTDVRFFSDTLKLKPIARLDLERELREALAQDQLRLRYAPRHDLSTGAIVAVHAYLRWPHPLRGEVRPSEFLPLAESTGLTTALSRMAFARLRADLPLLRQIAGPTTRVSFGALRHHFTGDALSADLLAWIEAGEIDARSLELRLSERALASLSNADQTIRRLAATGALIMVDEFGRDSSALQQLARMPLSGLQLDRSVGVASASDPGASRVASAAGGIARALGVVAICPAIDNSADRERFSAMGYAQGLGDLYGDIAVKAASTPAASSRASGY
jgi:predicted signal transduction protein with EAL and GGDEF domain